MNDFSTGMVLYQCYTIVISVRSVLIYYAWIWPDYLPDRYGSWGVCFTYGGWFGIRGLVAAGRRYDNCSSLRKACDFLLSKELASGGWGESYLSGQNKVVSIVELSSNSLAQECNYTLFFTFISISTRLNLLLAVDRHFLLFIKSHILPMESNFVFMSKS